MHAEAGPGRPANSPADSPRADHPGSQDAWKMINFAPVRNRAIGARRIPRKRLAPEEPIRQGGADPPRR